MSKVNISDTVRMKLGDGIFYQGVVSSLSRATNGKVLLIRIIFEDGDREETTWPRKDVYVVKNQSTAGESSIGRCVFVRSKDFKKLGDVWFKGTVRSEGRLEANGNVISLFIVFDDFEEGWYVMPNQDIIFLSNSGAPVNEDGSV